MLDQGKPIFMHFLNGNSSVPNRKCYLYVTSDQESTQGERELAHSSILPDLSRSQGVELMNNHVQKDIDIT